MLNNENKRLINTFKNGIVPEKHLDFILTGRDEEIKEFARCFENTKNNIGNVKFITGEYGSGKTFLLNYAKNMALELGFVVAKVEVDVSFKFYNLEQLYYHIMHNLYIQNSDSKKTSFEDIFELWIRKLKSVTYRDKAANEIQYVVGEIGKYNQSFARAFMSYIRAKITDNGELSEAVVSWLTGEGNIPFHVKEKFDIKGSVTKSNSIDFLKAFVKLITLLGYNGLIVLVDEMDHILSDRIDIRQKSYNNLRHLIDITISGELLNTSFVFSGSDRLFSDKERGIESYQALSQRLGDAIDKSSKMLMDIRQPIMHLRKISFEDYVELSEKLTYLYQKVFCLNLTISIDSLKNWVFLTYKQKGKEFNQVTIREFITKYIEIMDIINQNPDNHIFKSELQALPQKDTILYKSRIKK